MVGIVGSVEVDGIGVAWVVGTTGALGAGVEDGTCVDVGAPEACVWTWAWVTGAGTARGVEAAELDAVVAAALAWATAGVTAALGYVPASIALMVVPSVRSWVTLARP